LKYFKRATSFRTFFAQHCVPENLLLLLIHKEGYDEPWLDIVTNRIRAEL
jgi:hypothetical protein